jgi:hypothetical protein
VEAQGTYVYTTTALLTLHAVLVYSYHALLVHLLLCIEAQGMYSTTAALTVVLLLDVYSYPVERLS